ncbi:KLTH0A01034p [Lachancea thermotolerans CBS 6340]|uniref:KLTH0A01034p n=1 Tax=Lachancea thermotolerans (strain ATCC 56472 / CBS 6340 / NRRL Y-8284) TaxID=559295 RepID=C5DBA9_LACTC|nr:KLTH0A01034p [Lachancea thermotolerans CBS 6340]CAR21066.1 KLTH0A01034p [Lachancea thermotolerans CBS 6340]
MSEAKLEALATVGTSEKASTVSVTSRRSYNGDELSEIQQDLAQKHGVKQRKLEWKIDICVVPALVLLYFAAFLDRINISNARLYGMEEDLGLHGNQFNVALTVFFVPYIVFELVANYLAKLFKPHWCFSVSMFMFGCSTIGCGFVKSFGGLITVRVFLGVAESATFGLIFYILSSYYTPRQAQRRFSCFFSSVTLAGAAGGSIARQIYTGIGNKHLANWRWIFIIEGAATVFIAFLLFFITPDFPETAKFLKPNEKAFLKEKLQLYSRVESGFEVKFNWRDYLPLFKEPIFYANALAYLGLLVPSYGYAYFATSIIKLLGYTAVSAQQHSVYPWLAAFGYINIVAYLSDRLQNRWCFSVSSSIIGIAGLAMVLGSSAPHVRYGGCFVASLGLYGATPVVVCWTSINLGGHLRKSFGTAFQVGLGNIGGIIATFLFLQKDEPKYTSGLSVSIGFVGLSIISQLFIVFYCSFMNKKKMTLTYIERFEELPIEDRVLKGDLNPNFKYLL